VTSKSGAELALRVEDGTSFNVDGKAYTGPVKTSVGGKYVITKA
jgi:hypothetical protein